MKPFPFFHAFKMVISGMARLKIGLLQGWAKMLCFLVGSEFGFELGFPILLALRVLFPKIGEMQSG